LRSLLYATPRSLDASLNAQRSLPAKDARPVNRLAVNLVRSLFRSPHRRWQRSRSPWWATRPPSSSSPTRSLAATTARRHSINHVSSLIIQHRSSSTDATHLGDQRLCARRNRLELGHAIQHGKVLVHCSSRRGTRAVQQIAHLHTRGIDSGQASNSRIGARWSISYQCQQSARRCNDIGLWRHLVVQHHGHAHVHDVLREKLPPEELADEAHVVQHALSPPRMLLAWRPCGRDRCGSTPTRCRSGGGAVPCGRRLAAVLALERAVLRLLDERLVALGQQKPPEVDRLGAILELGRAIRNPTTQLSVRVTVVASTARTPISWLGTVSTRLVTERLTRGRASRSPGRTKVQ